MTKTVHPLANLPAASGGTTNGLTDAQLRAAALLISAGPVVHTDRSGTIAAGGTSQQLMPANANRKGWYIRNNHATASLFINGLGPATQTYTSLEIKAGEMYESPFAGALSSAINIIGPTTGQTFTAREF